MSAHSRADIVLHRTAEAVADRLNAWTAAELARRIGVTRTSISRDWQDDMSAWPWSKGIRFCCADPVLMQHHLAALQGAPETLPEGSPAQATRDLARRFAREIDKLIDRSADGRLDARESAQTEAELDDLAARITQLRALIRANRKRHA
jgi:hypothetical protein